MILRAVLLVFAFAASLLVLRFAGFLPALALVAVAAAVYRARRWFRHPIGASPKVEPLPGISLHVQDTPNLRLLPPPATHVEQLEIGATGPGELQFVLIPARRRATLKLSAEQARWMAGALNHWADSSETIPLH